MTIDPSSTKVLITGANGFIGLHTVLGWQACPYEGTIVEMAQSMMEQGMV